MNKKMGMRARVPIAQYGIRPRALAAATSGESGFEIGF
jgi:hypothetical protein